MPDSEVVWIFVSPYHARMTGQERRSLPRHINNYSFGKEIIEMNKKFLLAGFLLLAFYSSTAKAAQAVPPGGHYHWETLPGTDATTYFNAARTQNPKTFSKTFSKGDIKNALAGKLVKIDIGGNVSLIFENKSIAEVDVFSINTGSLIEDAIHMYGEPTKAESQPMENGFGATWTVVNERWKLSNGNILTISSSPEFGDASGTAAFQTPERQREIDNILHTPSNL
jgi:hypothetical protein